MADKNEKINKTSCGREDLIDCNIFIVWKPEYNLGIPIIDEQHRGIVSTINSLHYAMQHKLGENMLLPIINMVREYTHIHFDVEEDLLKKDGFPGLAYHRSLHQELIGELAHIGQKCLEDHDPYHFLEFLKNWWIKHICDKDRVYLNHRRKN